jgi:hypothetical protein
MGTQHPAVLDDHPVVSAEAFLGAYCHSSRRNSGVDDAQLRSQTPPVSKARPQRLGDGRRERERERERAKFIDNQIDD